MKKLLTILLILTLQLTNTGYVLAQEATTSADLTTEPLTSPSPSPLPLLDPIPSSTPASTLVSESLVDLTATSAATLESLDNNPNSVSSATIKRPAKLRSLSKHDFRSNEKVTVVVDNVTSSEITAVLLDNTGQNVEVEMEEIERGSSTIIRITPPLSFKPGKYKLMISGPNDQSWQQDFSWGVLAINTNKSIYLPNEVAKLAMAVLDDKGMMVCDARVDLRIKNLELGIDETLSTDNGKIKVNPECSLKGFTLKPDYEADHQVGGAGKYNLTLTAQTKNGTFTINDAFEVRDNTLFDIERVTATRIYPPATYPVTFNILANEDFEGEIEETVPESFAISPATGPSRSYDDLKAVSAKIKSDDLLQAGIANIGLPVGGQHSISLGFGQNLVDPQLKNLYEKYGLAGHDGIDFDMPLGTPVLAVDDGEAVRVRENDDYGNTVVIQHQWGKSYYGHLSQFEISQGQKILKGEVLGLSGSTGLSTAPHLHFGIKPNNNDPDNGYFGKVNPAAFLGLEDGTLTTPVKVISWKVKVQKGEKLTLGYQFKAPNISPEFYKLGSLKFIDQNSKLIFEEARLWQIAADVTTGPNYAGAVGTNGFTTPANAVGSTETTCTDDYSSSIISGFWNTFGFAIPSGDTIDGIQVEVKWAYNSDPPVAGGNGITVVKSETSLGTEQTFVTAEPAASTACGATQEIDVKGGVADKWGFASWTPAEVNATTFGVRIRKSITGNEDGLNINWIRVTITHTAGGAESPTQSQLMRHGKWFNAAGVEQPFTF